MYDQIKYDAPFGFGTFEHMATSELGEERLRELENGLELPDIQKEAMCGCRNMALFMDRLEDSTDADTVKRILKRVRHGLHPSQAGWAREDFLKFCDLDAYIAHSIDEGIKNFTRMFENGEDFYGQPVTRRALVFVKEHPSCLSARREGNKLYITAFPASMDAYVGTDDETMKRYYACHCPFAKESIRSDKPVSPTLCNCSLGHVANCWEAIFETELEGRVITSVLHGDMLCEYELTLPDSVMEKYVKRDQCG